MSGGRPSPAGHTVLAVPVPPLEAYVRTRTAVHDASFVSTDPDFAHAHLTLLAPWVPTPSAADLGVVAAIAAATEPFEVALESIEEFPDGLLHLRPRPDDAVRALTARLWAAFPEHPPYEGRYPEVVPHVTLERHSPTTTPAVTAATVAADLADALPARLRIERIDLQWWANHDCRRLHSWPLGGTA